MTRRYGAQVVPRPEWARRLARCAAARHDLPPRDGGAHHRRTAPTAVRALGPDVIAAAVIAILTGVAYGVGWIRAAAAYRGIPSDASSPFPSRGSLGDLVRVAWQFRRVPRVSAARVSCPRPEHAGSRLRLDGTYGKPGHRRQRYTDPRTLLDSGGSCR